MFRTFSKWFLPNPLDWKIKRCAKRGGKKILLGWNRGLGDLPLGLYAILLRIRQLLPDAHVTFVTREGLKEGFSLLDGVDELLLAPHWKRGEPVDIAATLRALSRKPEEYDCIIAAPSPTDWVSWQRGKVVPRLKYTPASHHLRFGLEGRRYIGVQPVAETNYGLWRNWPKERWEEVFTQLPDRTFLLFGFGQEPLFSFPNVIDLRGKTNLFELLSIVYHHCDSLILPDSGILSMIYYLDLSFPIRLISLWGDPHHGVLKQAVASPNPQLIHIPLHNKLRDLSSVSAAEVLRCL